MDNKVRTIRGEGKAVISGWLAIPSAFSAEVMAQCGFDSVTVDLQHGVQDYLSTVHCFQAMQPHPVTPGADDAAKCIACGFRLVTLTTTSA